MKSVRLFYKKTGDARFVSHLDTVRCMTRLFRRAGLPVWYTEGFNPHLYITFALPLSLGMESEYEVADIRLTDDDFPLERICGILNAECPQGYRFFKACEPKSKLTDLAAAKFCVEFEDGGTLKENLENFLKQPEILIEKKTKKGALKTINVAEDIKDFFLTADGNTKLFITLPAGNEKNINPDLIIKKYFSDTGEESFTGINRLLLLNENLEPIE